MTTVSTQMPDSLFNQAKAIADREKITIDELIALALAGQIASWEVGRQFEERKKRGSWKRALEILDKAPDVEPENYDRL
ncbi:MAG: hypothetical protein IT173_02155 [Acidobacteria bacterium]|nr:hypothetical protein [Acidobacteriota bacterium]